MGEEQKKLEGEKEEAKTKVDGAEKGKEGGGDGGDGKKEGGGDEKKADALPPPPPEEIEMRVFMHCEGCARKVRRSLNGFQGVESVRTDCRSHTVVVKGKKAAEDPMKVVMRVQKKTGRKVELLAPLPPPKPEKKEEEKTEEEKPKPVEKKEEVMAAMLRVHMHCEACAQEIKKKILKMKGVQSAEPDLKASQVTVKGVFTSQELVEYVYKRTGKLAVVTMEEPAEKKAEEEKKAAAAAKEEKKADDAGANAEGEKKEDKEGGGEDKDGKKEGGGTAEYEAAALAALPPAKMVESMRNELYYYPRYHAGGYAYPAAYPAAYPSAYPAAYPAAYPHPAYTHPVYPPQHYPQTFSDENPNACAVM